MKPPLSRGAKQFGEHFEAAVLNAASANPTPFSVTRPEFFLPPDERLAVRTNAVFLAIAARRMREVEHWLTRELAKFMPAEQLALPPAERAQAIKAAGFFGREHTFKDQAPGVMNMALYRRTEKGPPELIATMKWEPTMNPDFSGDNTKAGE